MSAGPGAAPVPPSLEDVRFAAARLFMLHHGGQLYALGMRHVEERFEARARLLLEDLAARRAAREAS